MTSAVQAILFSSVTLVLLSTHSGRLAYAEGSKRDDGNASPENLQNPIDVPKDVLLNTLYYLVGDVEYTPEDQGIPIYHISNLNKPRYLEIKLKPHGYLLAALTKEDFPVVHFNGESSVEIPTVALGKAHKYVTYDESFDIAGLDIHGKVIKSLSNRNKDWDISNHELPLEHKHEKMMKKLREQAEQRWYHDYVMECDRGHTIAVCSDKLGNGVNQLEFPEDFGTSEAKKATGTVWDDANKKFVELEKQGESWVKGTTASRWDISHISMVIEKMVGKCGYAKVNVPCDDKIYDSPLWIGDTRITIVNQILDDVDKEMDLKSQLPARQQTRGDWSSWGAWSTYSANNYALVPNYNQQSCCGCISGCGAVAWAMLFAWADQQIGFSHTIYGTAADIPPSTMTPAVETYIESIRSQIGTFCITGQGATYPWKMGDIKGWFQSRGGGDLKTSYDALGIRTDSLRDCASSAIINTKRPVVIGIGWLTHYPVATQYRTRSRTRSVIFGIQQTDTAREAYLNKGWGGVGNGWETLSTWFCGTISP